MKISNQAGQKYLIDVKRHLRCVSQTKKQFLETLQLALYNFEIENPDADYADYAAVFGEPKSTARQCLDELSDQEVFGYWKRVIAVVIAAILLVLALMAGWFLTHRETDDIPIYYVSSGDATDSAQAPLAAEE